MTMDEHRAIERAALSLGQIATDLDRGPSGDEEDVRAHEARVAERLRVIADELRGLIRDALIGGA